MSQDSVTQDSVHQDSDSTNHASASSTTSAGLTDAGARRLLTTCLVVSVLLGFAWGWSLYGTFYDLRIWNVVGLSVITVVFVVTTFVGIREWRRSA